MNRLHALMLAAAVAGPSLAAADYKFAEPRQLNGGDKAIEVEAPGYAAPGLGDVNGDGVLDLLVGQFRDGKLGFYKGSKGEDGKLTFGAHEWLQAGGEIATIPGVWWCTSSTPQVVDLNADGFNDILSGCYSQKGHDNMVGSYWVLYGDKDGKFAKATELMGTDGKLLQVVSDLKGTGDNRLTQNICSRPFAIDWDGDSDLDIVAGNFAGTFFVFTGEGKGKFAPKAAQLNDKDGTALKITGVHSDPFIVDWDNDGDLDLLTASSDGNISWAENVRKGDEKVTGADRTPELSALQVLIKAPAASKDVKTPSYGVRIFVADVTGDGKLDILAGDRFSSGGGMREDLTKEEKAAFEKADADYQQVMKDYQDAYKPYNEAYQAALKEAQDKADGEELSQEQLRAIYKEHVTDKVAKDEKLQGLLTKVRELGAELTKYRAASISGGNIWVYEQK